MIAFSMYLNKLIILFIVANTVIELSVFRTEHGLEKCDAPRVLKNIIFHWSGP